MFIETARAGYTTTFSAWCDELYKILHVTHEQVIISQQLVLKSRLGCIVTLCWQQGRKRVGVDNEIGRDVNLNTIVAPNVIVNEQAVRQTILIFDALVEELMNLGRTNGSLIRVLRKSRQTLWQFLFRIQWGLKGDYFCLILCFLRWSCVLYIDYVSLEYCDIHNPNSACKLSVEHDNHEDEMRPLLSQAGATYMTIIN